MQDGITGYINKTEGNHRLICEKLRQLIDAGLSDAESKIWHAHPVWFLDGNPIVGYSVQKPGVRLMFWSGQSFDEPQLVGKSKFKDASIFYNSIEEIDDADISRWLQKAKEIQWDYKNIIKRRGELVRIVPR